MNKEMYKSSMDHLPFHQNFETDVIHSIETGKKPRTGISKIPYTVKRAAEFAVAAACLSVFALFMSPLLHNNRINLPNSSSGVSARIVENPDLDGQTIPTAANLSEEELFARADTILSGTVSKIETLEIVLDSDVSYRSLITVQTDTVWKGAESPDSTVHILLPYAIDEKNNDTNNVLTQIRTGMRGIFLMETYTKDSLYTDGDKTLALMDLAPYGMADDSGAFLEKDNGMVYRVESFPSLQANPTFDQVCDYVDEMLGKLPTETDTTNTAGNSTETTVNNTDDGTNASVTNKTKKSETDLIPSSTAVPASNYKGPLTSDYDYIFTYSGGYYYIYSKDGTRKEFYHNSCCELQPDIDWIYYENYDECSTIYRCRPDGSEATMICGVKGFGSCYYITDDSIIFVNNYKDLYKINKDGSDLTYLCRLQSDITTFSCNNDYLFIADKTNLNRYSLTDGSYITIFKWDKTSSIYVKFVKDDWIFYEKDNDYKRIRTNGTEDTFIDNRGAYNVSDNTFFQSDDEYVYYSKRLQKRSNGTFQDILCRVPLDGSAQPEQIKTPLTDNENCTDLMWIMLQNGHFYLWYQESDTRQLYRINKDGTGILYYGSSD